MRRVHVSIVLLLTAALNVFAGDGDCVFNLSTGYDEIADIVLPEAVDDDSYTVDLGDGAVVALTGGTTTGFPIPPWIANDDRSLWISRSGNATDLPGIYTYEITFELEDAEKVSLLAIAGRWATDDPGVDVVINGTSTGIRAGGFTMWTDFPLGAGAGLFKEGKNVVQFLVENAGVDPNPTGLRVEACLELPIVEPRPGDISTGIHRDTRILHGDGEASDEYVITGPVGKDVPATAVDDGAFPIPPWLPSSFISRWIGVAGESSNAAPGEYVFKTEVTLPEGVDPALAEISGGFAADDQVTDILVNGKSSGITGGGFEALINFPALAGRGSFQAGVNTIEFVVVNGGESDNPVGLRVDAAVVEGKPFVDAPASLFSIDTGFDNESGVTIGNGEPDDNWVIIGPGIGPTLASVVPDNAFPIGPWVGSTAQSKWIGTANPSSNGPPATYTFRIIVHIPDGIDASTARMIGQWTSDNGGSDVLINGVSTGLVVTGNFPAFAPIPDDAGLGLFQNGDNVIDVLIINAPPGDNPVGLRVEGVVGTGTVDPTALATGVGQRGIGSLPGGSEDGRFLVTGPAGSGIGPRPAVVVTDDDSPIPPWAANSSTSSWIGLDGADSIGPAGIYTYELEVTIPAHLNAHRVALSGSWAAAGRGVDVLVNGQSAGAAVDGPATLTAFPAGAGKGLFLPGPNTITFQVENAAEGSTGLRVDATLVAVVEPNPFDISTGFDQAAGVLLEDNVEDDDYSVVDPKGVSQPALVLGPADAPIPPWVQNSASSRWVGPFGAIAAGVGDFIYEVTVDIPTAEQAAEATLVGFWTNDNLGVDVRINEQSAGLSNDGNFTTTHYFPPDAGLGLFVQGTNLIEFVVNNAGDVANPSGLRVDAVVAVPEGGKGNRFKRGDSDGSGSINITDGVFTLNFLFSGGATPPCRDAADADDSGVINITDGVYVLNFLFLGGPDPAEPFPDCGVDPQGDADGVTCEAAHAACV